MDMPFLFRDLDHWNKVLNGSALQPIADEVAKKADVMIIGYAGGGTRNIIANKPVRNMAELKGLTMRVMGAPIQTAIFQPSARYQLSLRTTRSIMPSRRALSRARKTKRPDLNR